MKLILIQFLAAFVGTAGAALVFRIDRRHLLPSAFGGLLTYGVYDLTIRLGSDTFLANFAGALFAALLAYSLAVFYRVPSTVFHTTFLIPLVPGALLYYMMYAMIRGDFEGVLSYGGDALRVGLGIAAGILLGGAVIRTVKTLRRRFLAKKKQP